MASLHSFLRERPSRGAWHDRPQLFTLRRCSPAMPACLPLLRGACYLGSFCFHFLWYALLCLPASAQSSFPRQISPMPASLTTPPELQHNCRLSTLQRICLTPGYQWNLSAQELAVMSVCPPSTPQVLNKRLLTKKGLRPAEAEAGLSTLTLAYPSGRPQDVSLPLSQPVPCPRVQNQPIPNWVISYHLPPSDDISSIFATDRTFFL